MTVSRVLALAFALALALASPTAAQDDSRGALAHQLYDRAVAGLSAGTTTPSQVYEWSVRWMRADLDARVANAVQAHVERMRALEASVRSRVAAGVLGSADGLACRYYVAEALAWLAHPPS